MRHLPSYPPTSQLLARSAAEILPPVAPLAVPMAPHRLSGRDGHGGAHVTVAVRVTIAIALLLAVLILTAS